MRVSDGQIPLLQVVVAASGSQGRPDLGVGKTARQGSITTVPERSDEVASRFLDHQLHQCAGVEVDEGHRSAPLLAHPLGDGPTRPRTQLAGCRRSALLQGPGDHALLGETFQHWGDADWEQPSYGHPAIGDDHFMPIPGAGQPIAQMRSKLGYGDVHDVSVHDEACGIVRLRPYPRYAGCGRARSVGTRHLHRSRRFNKEWASSCGAAR